MDGCTPRASSNSTPRSETKSAIYSNVGEFYQLSYRMFAVNQALNNRRKANRADLQDSMKNYPTKQSLSAETMIDPPKKEGLLHSVFKSATNLLGEHLNRGIGSLIKNSLNMNNPLSVTVVSPDLLKSLHQEKGKDHQSISADVNLFATSAWCKDSHNSDETLASVLYDNEIISGSGVVTKQGDSSDPSDVDKRWKEYKCMYVSFDETPDKMKKDEKIVNSVNTKDCEEIALQSNCNILVEDEKDVDKSSNFGNTLSVDDEPFVEVKHKSSVQMHETEQQTQMQIAPSLVKIVGTLLTNTYNKVVNGMTDLPQLHSELPEDDPSLFFTKPGASIMPKPKKLHTVSSGRGRGRARSQLRRSGVSQKRHRKKRSRYDRSEDIKYDIDNWEEIENCSDFEDETVESMDVCDFGGCISNSRKYPMTISLEDIKPKMRKQKADKNYIKIIELFNEQTMDIDDDENDDDDDDDNEDDDNDDDSDSDYDDDEDDNESSESEFEYEKDVSRCNSRIRLWSISSVDSDDSFIVFNSTTETESKLEVEFETETETETETEIDITNKNKKNQDEDETALIKSRQPSKIRFDLTPVVHTIVHWRFAHEAARRGPWEQMARDRLRFRDRCNRIDFMLKPVFTEEHRIRIWNERFANNAADFSV